MIWRRLAARALMLVMVLAACDDSSARANGRGKSSWSVGSQEPQSSAQGPSGRPAADAAPIIARPSGKPNILFVLVDDQRSEGTLCMPKLRSLIGTDGVEFTSSFASSSPSPAAGDVARSSAEERAVNRWFRQAGYRTALIGDFAIGYDEYLREHPGYVPAHWDDWYALPRAQGPDFRLIERDKGAKSARTICYLADAPATQGRKHCQDGADDTRKGGENYATDILRNKALAVIQASQKEGRPFFIRFSPRALNGYDSPRRYQSVGPKLEFTEEAIKRLGDCPFFEWKNKSASYLERDVSDKPKWVRQLAGETTEDQLERTRQKQLVSVLAVEDALEAMLKKLKELGIDDETIIVFSAESGHSWGDHGYLGKNCGYEECIRVPLIVYDPRTPARGGKRVDALVESADLAPTLADLAGIPFTPDPTDDGKSFKALIDGKGDFERDQLLIQRWGSGHKAEPMTLAGVRTKHWKYMQHYEDRERRTAAVRQDGVNEAELYDLQKDPRELDNLLGIGEKALKDKGHTRGEIDAVLTDHVKRLAGLTAK